MFFASTLLLIFFAFNNWPKWSTSLAQPMHFYVNIKLNKFLISSLVLAFQFKFNIFVYFSILTVIFLKFLIVVVYFIILTEFASVFNFVSKRLVALLLLYAMKYFPYFFLVYCYVFYMSITFALLYFLLFANKLVLIFASLFYLITTVFQEFLFFVIANV